MNAKAQELAVHSDAPGALTPLEILNRAVSSGATTETLAQLMTLQERWEANQARKAFVEARARAKAKLVETPILKNRIGHNNKRYADFSAYATVIDPVLADNDLSYGFETEYTDRITVTCVLSHADGHETRNALSGPPDKTGNKNDIQAIGSTVTYLQRYTLTAALGLSASEDDDGKAGGAGPTLSDEQVQELGQLLAANKIPVEKFLKVLKADAITAIPANQYEEAKRQIEDAIAARARKLEAKQS
jgi:hypothetical protein